MDILFDAGRRSPSSPDSGLTELFYLMEQVLPGMQGLTGVVLPVAIAPQRHRNPLARRARVQADLRDRKRLEMIEIAAGAEGLADVLKANIKAMEGEIIELKKQLEAMRRMGRRYRLLDWEKIARLEEQSEGLRLIAISLPWQYHRSRTYKAARDKERGLRSQLAELKRQEQPGDVDALLYNDPKALTYRRKKDRLAYLKDRKKDFERRLKEAEDKARRQAIFKNLNLSGDWLCGRAKHGSGNAKIKHRDDTVTIDMKWAPQKRAPRPFSFKAVHVRGKLYGSWFDKSTKTTPILRWMRRGDTRMTFKAEISDDGKSFEFTDAPRHPRSGVEWQGVVCKRATPEPTVAAADFLSVATPQSIESNRLTTNEKKGLIVVVAHTPGGKDIYPRFKIYKGRRGLPALQEHWVPPGTYKLAITLGGRIHRRTVSILSQKQTVVSLRPGEIKAIEKVANGRTLQNQIRVYQDKVDGTPILVRAPGDKNPLLLGPGIYRLEFGSDKGLALSRERVEVRPGQVTPVNAVWSQLRAVADQAIKSPSVRPAVGESSDRHWIGLSETMLSRDRGGLAMALPAGKLEIRFKIGGKVVQRRITLREGEVKEINLN